MKLLVTRIFVFSFPMLRNLTQSYLKGNILKHTIPVLSWNLRNIYKFSWILLRSLGLSGDEISWAFMGAYELLCFAGNNWRQLACDPKLREGELRVCILGQMKPAPLSLTNLPLSLFSSHRNHPLPPSLLLTFPKSSPSHHTGSLTAMAHMKTLHLYSVTAPLEWPGYLDLGSPFISLHSWDF